MTARRWLVRVVPVLVVAGLAVAGAATSSRVQPPAAPTAPAQEPPAPAPPTRVYRAPEDVAAPHLARADRACDAAIDACLRPLDALFTGAKQNTRGFADDALGWSSKWRLVVDHLPFTPGNDNRKFLLQKFEARVLRPADLDAAVRRAVGEYLACVRSAEGQLLFDLRADAPDLPPTALVAGADLDGVRAAFDRAMDRTRAVAGQDLTADVGREVLVAIVAEVVARAAVRLGVSAGVLGAGAATGVASLGVSLVAGMIIDQLVGWVWDRLADPRGRLAAGVDHRLDEIRRAIVDGADGTPGLRERLRQHARERAAARRAAVLDLLRAQPGE